MPFVLGCGGDPFTFEPADATAHDGAGEGPPDVTTDPTVDGEGSDVAPGADATTLDARAGDARDGADSGRDAIAFDASVDDGAREAAQKDVDANGDADAEGGGGAPPVHCGGGSICAAAVPSGWSGPFELNEGPGPSPACDPAFSARVIDAHAGLTAPAPSCGCSCGLAGGVVCSTPTLTFFGSPTTCATLGLLPCSTTALTPGACTAVDMTGQCGTNGVSVDLPASVASQGSCTPLAATAFTPAGWAANARGCEANVPPPFPTDCATGSACVPSPSAPFQSGLCIAQSGDVACMAPGYTVRHLYFTQFLDTRGCSACTCGPVAGASCVGSVDQFMSTDGQCTGLQTSYPLGHDCYPLQQPADLQFVVSAKGGACTPSAVGATGTALAVKPFTFCCAP
jgi:hypothetical protein